MQLKKELYNSLTIPITLIGIIIDIFLLVDGVSIFGSIFEAYQQPLIIYLIMLGAVLFIGKKVPGMDIGIGKFTIYFTIAFIPTALVIGTLVKVNVLNSNLSLQYYLLQIVFQIFVVAFAEEMIFRGVIQQYLGFIGQGVLFGFFHIAAYSTELPSSSILAALIIAMIFGILMGAIVKIMTDRGEKGEGLSMTIGIHSAFNLALTTGLFAAGALI